MQGSDAADTGSALHVEAPRTSCSEKWEENSRLANSLLRLPSLSAARSCLIARLRTPSHGDGYGESESSFDILGRGQYLIIV